jgi:hypothetical protein
MMTRSRMFVWVSLAVVGCGVAVGLGALWLDPARAAVGPLPAEALILPADARFVFGVDVKRLTASPFYARFRGQARPDAFRELEARTGLNPERDLESLVVAGRGDAGQTPAGLVLMTGAFDAAALGKTMAGAGRGATVQTKSGVPVYTFRDGSSPSSVALLGKRALLLGPPAAVDAALASRAKGEAPLRANATLLGLVEQVKPGSTFWMVGDQSLLNQLPRTVGAGGGGGFELPSLRSVMVTGDLDPVVALSVTGEAADETAARSLADLVRGLVALATVQASQRPELKQLASAISVTSNTNRVLVEARLPYDLIEALQPKGTAVTPGSSPRPGGAAPAPAAPPADAKTPRTSGS